MLSVRERAFDILLTKKLTLFGNTTHKMLTQYNWPNLSGKKVLVVGLGGGCDAIMAYAIAKNMIEPLTQAVGFTNSSTNS
jgi:hypothetical protein